MTKPHPQRATAAPAPHRKATPDGSPDTTPRPSGSSPSSRGSRGVNRTGTGREQALQPGTRCHPHAPTGSLVGGTLVTEDSAQGGPRSTTASPSAAVPYLSPSVSPPGPAPVAPLLPRSVVKLLPRPHSPCPAYRSSSPSGTCPAPSADVGAPCRPLHDRIRRRAASALAVHLHKRVRGRKRERAFPAV